MTKTSLIVLLALALAAERPTKRSACDESEFPNGPGPYELAKPKPGATRIDAADDCLSGDLAKYNRTPLEPTRTWFAGNRMADWVCVSDGIKFGWAKKDELAFERAPERPPKDWVGTWDREWGSGTIKIRIKNPTTLEVTGDAQWVAGPEAEPHTGSLEAEARPSGIELVLGDGRCVAPDRAFKPDTIPDCINCHARLVLIGTTLLVVDNRMCGGMNVNFDGIYTLTAPAGGPRSRRSGGPR